MRLPCRACIGNACRLEAPTHRYRLPKVSILSTAVLNFSILSSSRLFHSLIYSEYNPWFDPTKPQLNTSASSKDIAVPSKSLQDPFSEDTGLHIIFSHWTPRHTRYAGKWGEPGLVTLSACLFGVPARRIWRRSPAPPQLACSGHDPCPAIPSPFGRRYRTRCHRPHWAQKPG